MKHARVVLFAVCCLMMVPLGAVAQKKQQELPKFPGEDSAARQTAAKYNFSMNMLLFPDYFMTEEQFKAMADNNFNSSNMETLVDGLNKYGLKVNVPKSAKEYRQTTYPALLDFLKKAGFVAIEVPVNAGTVELCQDLRKQLEQRKFNVTAVGGSDSDLEKSLKARIDCANALGAKVMAGPIVLPFKQYPENAIGDARVAWVNQRLQELRGPMRRVAEYAKSKDVKLAVEPLNRFELPGLNRLQQAIAFVRMVKHPNFGVMIDTCHELSDGDGPGRFAFQVKALMKMDRLFHIHISAIHRGRVDRGWIQWWGFFTPVLKQGYKGNMSMEIFDAAEPFASAVHINRKRFENPPEVALSALLHSAKRLQQVEKRVAAQN